MATVPVFPVTFNLIIPHRLTKRQLQGQIYMVLEPPSPGTSSKQQEGSKEVKRGKKPKQNRTGRVREHKMEMDRKKGKPICSIEKYYSLDFPQLLMA